MPELPDVVVYVEAIRPRVVGRVLDRVLIRSPFLVRSAPPEPGPEECEGRVVRTVSRLGKRIVLGLAGDLFMVFHLMIAGRFRWKEGPHRPSARIEQAAFQFARTEGGSPASDTGTLVLTEAGTKHRASLYIQRTLAGSGPGAVEPLECEPEAFAAAMRRENHTLKRALTDPRLVSGIGNAYSDEILHAARLSPLKLTSSLKDGEAAALFEATRATLVHWISELRRDFGMEGGGPGRFPGPGEITAFRPGFAVHGRFGLPCPVCGAPVQRIVHAERETNYCAGCQTGGRVLADRSLSRLLRDDWPRTLEELEGR